MTPKFGDTVSRVSTGRALGAPSPDEEGLSAPRARHRRQVGTTIEWPTLTVAVLIYGGWLAFTWWHAALPTPLIVVIGG